MHDDNGVRRQLVKGFSVILELHKTMRHPLILWLSQIDVVYGRCYEVIRRRYLKQNFPDRDPFQHDLPFFINSKGNGMGYCGLNWTDFSMVNGITQVTSRISRKMQSQFIQNHGDGLLKEAREFMLCHSESTDREFYQSHLDMENLSRVGQATYRTVLGLDAVSESPSSKGKGRKAKSSKLPTAVAGQLEMERREADKIHQRKIQKYLEQEAKTDAAVVPTLHRLLNNKHKTALVETIIHCHNQYITKIGDTADIFLSGKFGGKHAVVRKENARVMMRMILLADPELPYVKVLKESLMTFVSLSKEKDLVKIEWAWAFRLVICIKNLMAAKGVSCKNLLHKLAIFNTTTGNQYYLGNLSIFNMISIWQSMDIVRASKLTEEEFRPSVQEFLEKQRGEIWARETAVDEENNQEEQDIPEENNPPPPPRYKLWPASTACKFGDDQKLQFLILKLRSLERK